MIQFQKVAAPAGGGTAPPPKPPAPPAAPKPVNNPPQAQPANSQGGNVAGTVSIENSGTTQQQSTTNPAPAPVNNPQFQNNMFKNVLPAAGAAAGAGLAGMGMMNRNPWLAGAGLLGAGAAGIHRFLGMDGANGKFQSGFKTIGNIFSHGTDLKDLGTAYNNFQSLKDNRAYQKHFAGGNMSMLDAAKGYSTLSPEARQYFETDDGFKKFDSHLTNYGELMEDETMRKALEGSLGGISGDDPFAAVNAMAGMDGKLDGLFQHGTGGYELTKAYKNYQQLQGMDVYKKHFGGGEAMGMDAIMDGYAKLSPEARRYLETDEGFKELHKSLQGYDTLMSNDTTRPHMEAMSSGLSGGDAFSALNHVAQLEDKHRNILLADDPVGKAKLTHVGDKVNDAVTNFSTQNTFTRMMPYMARLFGGG